MVVSLGAYAAAGFGLKGQRARATSTTYGAILVAANVGAWLAIRFSARRADPVLFPTAALLGGLGLAMLYRLPARGLAQSRRSGSWSDSGCSPSCCC